MATLDFLLVNYQFPYLLNLLPRLEILDLIAHNSTQIVHYCENIELQRYLFDFYVLQGLKQSFEWKFQTRVLVSDGGVAYYYHFEHFVEDYFIRCHAMIASQAYLVLYTAVL